MERWQMNRLGFVNFWLYDTDEFPLRDGKLLLRGTNGSGKSITTQSFIPFILDGDKHPSRLDPFGSKDRKMSWYLLGDAENGKDESTAYLYLEFIKPESRQYRTIGIGLHAKKGGNMKTWGFCLKDGRRVGIDFQLYSVVGGKNIPYDTVKLKNQLSDDSRNIFVDKTSDYKEMVARHIFGIKKEQISDFDQLTNILIKTRSSKLSKDNLKPAQLYSILNDSLQILSDDDLQPMADAMSKLEDSHNKIEEAQKALEEIRFISAEYDRYNRYVLWKKAEMYLDKASEVNKVQSQIEETEIQIQYAQKEKESATLKQEQCEKEAEDLKREKDSLNITDFEEQLIRKTDAEKRLHSLKKDFDFKQQQTDKVKERLGEYYRRATEIQEQLSADNYNKDKLLSELKEYEEYSFPLHESYISEINHNADFCERMADCRHEHEKLSAALKNALAKLTELDSRREKRETAAVTLNEYETAMKNSENEYNTASMEFNKEKDRIIEDFYKASHDNREFKIDEMLLSRIVNAVEYYEGQGSANSINSLLQNQRDTLYAKLMELIVKTGYDKSEKQREYDSLCAELEELKNTSEPHPERSSERVKSRRLLEENNIKFRSFYECIDFQKGLSEQERAVIEAELSDMGLLDALVIPETHRNAASQLLCNTSDSYILTDTETKYSENNLFTITASEEFRTETERIIALFGEKAFVGKDGFYRNGIVAGHSLGTENARYIGAENRKTFRLKQIELLNEQIAAALDKLNKAVREYSHLQSRLQIFNDEYESKPKFSELNTALDMLFAAENRLKEDEKSYNNAAAEYEKAESEFNKALAQVSIVCSIFPDYERTAEFYTEVTDAADDYYNIIYSIIDILRETKRNAEYLQSTKEQISASEYDLECYDLEQKRIRNNIHDTEEVIRLCNEFLNREDIAEKVQRVQEIADSLKRLDEEIRNCIAKITRYETDTEHYTKSISGLKSALEKLTSEETVLSSYYKEELELGFVIDYGDITLKQSAQQAVKLVTSGDEKKGITEITERLSKVFRGHNSILSAHYRPMMDPYFNDEDSENLRSRYIITLTWIGKQLPPKAFETELYKTIEQDKLLIKKSEEDMFKDILLNTISKKLYNRINDSRRWVEEMSELMKSINTSMGLTFSLSWKPRKDISENELHFEELYKLLIRDKALISHDDYERLSGHFRSKIEHERLNAEEQGVEINYTELVKNVMDFRNWFEFKIYFKRSGNPQAKELTTSRFNTFSGGERALSLYIPLFAAVAAQYKKAGESAPKIIALDEAFAGVDDSNISEMFGLLEKLGFGYIINSQALWGCYDTVTALEIAELCHEKDSDIITVIYYEWNGKQKMLDDNI